MQLRHLRAFKILAEELHYDRAAERLHIEKSTLSKTIGELEDELRTSLLVRNPRTKRLTPAGEAFLIGAKRTLAAFEQTQDSVRACREGFRGSIRLAVSDGVAPQRLGELLARCRVEEPDVYIQLSDVPLAQQLRGLRADEYDVGLAHVAPDVEGLVCVPAWTDPLVLAIPARHPLLGHKRVPLAELLKHPLVLFDAELVEGAYLQVEQLLRTVDKNDEDDKKPTVSEYAATFEAMTALVAAGYGVGFANGEQLKRYRHPEVIARPLAGRPVVLTTYVLRPDVEPSEQLARFIGRAVGANDEDANEEA